MHETMGSTTNINSTVNNSSPTMITNRIPLITIYSLVLVAGVLGLAPMIRVVQSKLNSWTNIAYLNLIIAHLIFLFFLPFRIYYYASGSWNLSQLFCKVASAMMHLHMYIIFAIYVAILAISFWQYRNKNAQLEFYRKFHAIAVTVGVWIVLLIVGPIVLHQAYGAHTSNGDTVCFNFGKELDREATLGFNTALSAVTVIVSVILTSILGFILYSIVKVYGKNARDQHEFWAQMKNVGIILIILMCLVPYHLFRLYYMRNYEKLYEVNELFLAGTSFTCFDMLLIYVWKIIHRMCIS